MSDRFAAIAAEQSRFPVKFMCTVLGVSVALRSVPHPAPRTVLPIIPKLQLHAEVLALEQRHHFLQVVTRRTADAHLFALNRCLDLFQLRVILQRHS